MTKNFTDALGKDLTFVVLRKKNRLQVLYRPRKKQVRERGKKGWNLLAAIDHSEKEERQLLDRLLEGFLNDLTGKVPAPKVEKVKKRDVKKESATVPV